MQVRAIAKRISIAPQKARWVADQVRGKSVAEALDILNLSTRKRAGLVRKGLERTMKGPTWMSSPSVRSM
jgi:large subunit ribosomal protein L22